MERLLLRSYLLVRKLLVRKFGLLLGKEATSSTKETYHQVVT